LRLQEKVHSLRLLHGQKNSFERRKSSLNEGGGRAELYICDLSRLTSIRHLISQINNRKEGVDIVVNVAGVWHGKNEVYAGKLFEEFTERVILDTFQVGIIAPALLVHSFIPHMSRGSCIVNISGTFENGAKGWLPYYVSKRAIEDLTIGLSQELKEKGIRVNAISPPDTATEAYQKYFPQYMDEAIDPEEIAKEAVFLCSQEASSMTGKVFVMKKGKTPYEGFHA
jgi:NAD(P)-dependent dehydrogenase (short-subunit alcohol dehydrogenase family)